MPVHPELKLRSLLAFFLACSCLGAYNASGQETRRSIVGAPPVAAQLKDLAWLAGAWSGPGIDGGVSSESWSAAAGGQMVGHFRQLKADGSVWFYELITISQRGGTLEMRLKHFNSDLTGWEDQNSFMSFPLVAVEPNGWYFDGLTLRREGPRRLRYHVRVKHDNGTTEELEFRMKRSNRVSQPKGNKPASSPSISSK